MVQIINLFVVATAAISGASAACACTPNQIYCGWALLGEFGCTIDDLSGTVGSNPSNQLYTCASDGASAGQLLVCPGGDGHCQPPSNDHCNGVDYCCF